MNILLIGSGGREDALAWKLAQSPRLQKLFIAPGNGGTGRHGNNVAVNLADHDAVVDFCRVNGIDLVVIGPEAPLVEGIADALRQAGIAAFGPSAAAAQLEGSKHFTKKLCDRMDIPTAAYGHFLTLDGAQAFLEDCDFPTVIKADGLAAGKGVTIAGSRDEAEAALRDCFDGQFGAAGAEVVIEEFLRGEEASMFFLCDGETALPFGTAQDHKRVGEKDTGPNTGGMGAYSPAPVMNREMQDRVQQEIIQPTLRGMVEAGTPFSGVLYAGLMMTADGPKLIEYNVRFGDPECQVLMMRLDCDLVSLLHACAKGHLDGQTVRWRMEAALTVVMAAEGYPGPVEPGSRIRLPEDDTEDTMVFHAGTRRSGNDLLANGGRVLNVTALGADVTQAAGRAYALVDRIDWPEGFCRRDIGWRAIEREKGARD